MHNINMRRFKFLREQINLTQKKLSLILKIPQYTYSRIENEKTEADYETLSEIAKFYGVSVDYLLGVSDNPKPLDTNLDSDIAKLRQSIYSKMQSMNEDDLKYINETIERIKR